MIEAKRQAALAKVKRALEGGVLAAGATIVSQMPVIYPQSPAPSSQKTPLTPEQKTMIEAKRQVALAKVKSKESKKTRRHRATVIVEDASDSEYEGDELNSVWRNQRPSPGE
jgi:hypothetical protein